MAKKKGKVRIITLECTEARKIGQSPSRYTTKKNTQTHRWIEYLVAVRVPDNPVDHELGHWVWSEELSKLFSVLKRDAHTVVFLGRTSKYCAVGRNDLHV